jgi:hypothetical protein
VRKNHGKPSVRVAARTSQAGTVQYKNNEQYNTHKKNSSRVLQDHRTITDTQHATEKTVHIRLIRRDISFPDWMNSRIFCFSDEIQRTVTFHQHHKLESNMAIYSIGTVKHAPIKLRCLHANVSFRVDLMFAWQELYPYLRLLIPHASGFLKSPEIYETTCIKGSDDIFCEMLDRCARGHVKQVTCGLQNLFPTGDVYDTRINVS